VFLRVDNTGSTSLGVVVWLAPGREEETLEERDEDMGDEPASKLCEVKIFLRTLSLNAWSIETRMEKRSRR